MLLFRHDPDNHSGVVTHLEPEILECEGKWTLVSQLVSSVAQSCLTLQPHELQHARPPCPSLILELTQTHTTESVIPSNHLILCHPILLLPSTFPSIRVFSNMLILCIRWPQCWSFSFSISPSNAYSRLISIWIDWFDPLAVQGDS